MRVLWVQIWIKNRSEMACGTGLDEDPPENRFSGPFWAFLGGSGAPPEAQLGLLWADGRVRKWARWNQVKPCEA